MRSWYIEDAGGGCRAFSEVLVLVSEDPCLIYQRLMPLTWNNDITFEEMARLIVVEMMIEAEASHNDYFYVCSGNIFYGLHKWLTENGYNWETTKMDGLAHDVAESAFQKQLLLAGFPAGIKLEERNYRDFYRTVESWIKEDPTRKRFFKDMTVRRKPEQFRYILKGNSSHTRKCAKCQKKISAFSPIVQYRCRENGKKKNRYYHPECSPYKPHKNKLEEAHFLWMGSVVSGVVLPLRKAAPCSVCGLELLPGTRAVHAGNGKKVICGHIECFNYVNKEELNG
ncbi:hypothetical protein SAMN05660649_04152 [Desulfotomaculum arcticum]|uniref:Uncharacterized protein n=1 Tax=Desulfotruncus arcticus DSM 17038 TaxID=1121424 RepID=A0A1I2XW99_9FIRM|nr:hypothetical protein [Desulfotruncus arcticus]SFH17675.1 hypothetical protein SAMN05660649_04152 [Desulfotomaculum arcticum] [Desulfotruncus arcticus DSM 17038]